MSEYASGLTFGKCCNLDKDRIKHALKGELFCGEDENGFLYEKASKEDCERYILQAYDNAVFHAKQAMDSGRVLDRMLRDIVGDKLDMSKYIAYMGEETLKFNDYEFESVLGDEEI